MPAKKSNNSRLKFATLSRIDVERPGFGISAAAPKEIMNLRSGTMCAKNASRGNQYLCALERNQNGKYNVRVRALFGPGERNGDRSWLGDGKAGWSLPVYFLASSFNAAMKKLEESLQLLQKNEAKLRFWGLERTDDPNVAGELLQEFGLWLDRRRDYPRKAAEISAASERPIPASTLASIRRVLADSLSQERPAGRPALAGD
jgi:hypothetical protein